MLIFYLFAASGRRRIPGSCKRHGLAGNGSPGPVVYCWRNGLRGRAETPVGGGLRRRKISKEGRGVRREVGRGFEESVWRGFFTHVLHVRQSSLLSNREQRKPGEIRGHKTACSAFIRGDRAFSWDPLHASPCALEIRRGGWCVLRSKLGNGLHIVDDVPADKGGGIHAVFQPPPVWTRNNTPRLLLAVALACPGIRIEETCEGSFYSYSNVHLSPHLALTTARWSLRGVLVAALHPTFTTQ